MEHTTTLPENPERPVRLDDSDDVEAARERYDLLLLDVWRKGCSQCAGLEPVLGNVARASDVTVAMYNPEHDAEFVEKYDVRSVPTLLLFREGELVGRLAEGFQGAERILSFVDEHR